VNPFSEKELEQTNAFIAPDPIKLFFSYAHEDRPFRTLLGKHLAPLVHAKVLTQWYDGDIQAGIEWAEETYRQLNKDNFMSN
jgi:hypothetical protein